MWNVIKNFEKFKDGKTHTPKISKPPGYVSSGSKSRIHDSSQVSPGVSSFS